MTKNKYNEILKLKTLLEEAAIPFIGRNVYDGYQIVIYHKVDETVLCDAIEHSFTYGSEVDRLEIQGAITLEETKDDSVLGYLTAEEVFKRFKFCYDNNVFIYLDKEVKK